MSYKLQKLWILPEGPLWRERWRRVLRTTSLHFLLRCCAPTASKSAPTEAGENPNARKSRISQPCENTLLTTLWSFWLSFWDLRSLLGSLKCAWRWVIRNLKYFILFVYQNFKWMCQYTWNRKTFDLLPKGRLTSGKRGECFAPFSFALLRADSLKKCANGGRRKPECSKISNFTTLRKHSFDNALIILTVILRFEITTRKLEVRLKMGYS